MQVKTLVAEYYVANDLEEAVRCVVALDAAHFGHEIVKRTVYEALERGGAGTSAYGVLLLKTLLSRHALDAAQISKVSLCPPPSFPLSLQHTLLLPLSLSSFLSLPLSTRLLSRHALHAAQTSKVFLCASLSLSIHLSKSLSV